MTILHHAGICVADIDEALRFYRDGVGLTVLVDRVIEADLETLLGVPTRRVRTVFLGAADHPDGGIVELLDLDLKDIAGAPPNPGCRTAACSCSRFRWTCPGCSLECKTWAWAGRPEP